MKAAGHIAEIVELRHHHVDTAYRMLFENLDVYSVDYSEEGYKESEYMPAIEKLKSIMSMDPDTLVYVTNSLDVICRICRRFEDAARNDGCADDDPGYPDSYIMWGFNEFMGISVGATYTLGDLMERMRKYAWIEPIMQNERIRMDNLRLDTGVGEYTHVSVMRRRLNEMGLLEEKLYHAGTPELNE